MTSAIDQPPTGAEDALEHNGDIKRRLEENELAGERIVNHIRLAVILLGGAALAFVWDAQSLRARWMFAVLIAGYGICWASLALLLRSTAYRPRLKFIVTTIDIAWLFALTAASLFNHSGIYETYRAPMPWLLLALFNGLTALRLNIRLSWYAGLLTLALGFTELALIAHFIDVPWSSVSVYFGVGINIGDVVQTVLFSAVPAFAAVFVAKYARRLVHESAQGAAERARAEGAAAMALGDLAQARELANAKERFMRVASHELRTPIHVLELATELLEATPLDNAAQVEKLRTRIQRQATRLATLVDQLLDSSRLAGERLDLHREPCTLDSLCREVANDLDPTGARIDIQADTSVAGFWDASRMHQVITNLLSNALRYSPSDAVVSVVVYGQCDDALLVVKDHGIGIAPDDIPHLFSPFFRSTAARQHDASGLGLGLHIVNEIVRLHGGSIHVSSELGEGTTFTVELPVQLPVDATPSAEPPTQRPTRLPHASLH